MPKLKRKSPGRRRPRTIAEAVKDPRESITRDGAGSMKHPPGWSKGSRPAWFNKMQRDIEKRHGKIPMSVRLSFQDPSSFPKGRTALTSFTIKKSGKPGAALVRLDRRTKLTKVRGGHAVAAQFFGGKAHTYKSGAAHELTELARVMNDRYPAEAAAVREGMKHGHKVHHTVAGKAYIIMDRKRVYFPHLNKKRGKKKRK